MLAPSTRSTPSPQSAPLGVAEARLYTPPLRELTPETSFGYDVIDFARDVLNTPLDPWQEWLVIHAGELLPDGRPRFKHVLVIVGRQSGKTFLVRVLTLFWLYVERHPMTLGMSHIYAHALDGWRDILRTAESCEWLAPLTRKPRARSGEHAILTALDTEYRIAAANDGGGRGLSLDRVVIDEIRMHKTWDAWGAVTPAMNARPMSQLWAITNQGDDESIVLNDLRDGAIKVIESDDPAVTAGTRLGLFEYSAPAGADPLDLHALAQSNPNLGHRVETDALLDTARRAVAAGGLQLSQFRTEVMCQRVVQLDSAIDPFAWDRCAADRPFDPRAYPKSMAWCIDVSLDGHHVTLVAAATGQPSGMTFVRTVAAWDGPNAAAQARAALPQLLADYTPRTLGWFNVGPAGVLGTELLAPSFPRFSRTTIEPISAPTPAVCMGLADVVQAEQVAHVGNDPLLNLHVKAAGKRWTGDRWVFRRPPTTPVDAAWAVAGAVHLARSMTKARPPLRVST
jgi:hypothetical protein